MRRALSVLFALGIVASGTLGSLPGGASEGGRSGAQASSTLTSATGALQEKPSLAAVRPRWVEGQVLVQWKPGIERATARSRHARRGAQVLSRIGAFGGIDVVRLRPGMSVERGLRSYRRAAGVTIVEPNLLRDWHNHVPTAPDDTRFTELWGLHNTGQPHGITGSAAGTSSGLVDRDIDAPEAWAAPHTFAPVIAVVDSGVRDTHEDLVGQLWEDPMNPGVFGRSFTAKATSTNITDTEGHGTHVSGTIAAAANNAKGIAGVCPQCKIMVLKFNLTLAAELKAFEFARKNGAHIVNGSFGGGAWSKLERNAIRQLGNAGILAVFSAGNASFDNDMFLMETGGGAFSPSFPSSYTLPNILAVAATNDRDEYAYSSGCRQASNPKWACAFTSFGAESVDVAAPGVDILSSVPTSNNAYSHFDGTSMASPHVAGIAGLVKSRFPGRGHQAIKNMIMRGVDKPSSLGRMYSFIFGPKNATGRFTRTGGRVNAAKVLAAGTSNATPKTDGNIDGARRARVTNSGRVSYPHDINDVFKRRLQKGKTYSVRLTVPKGRDYDLWVYKPGTTEIHQLEESCFAGRKACKIFRISSDPRVGKHEGVRFRAPQTGVYFFQVQAWLKHAGAYTLSIKQA